MTEGKPAKSPGKTKATPTISASAKSLRKAVKPTDAPAKKTVAPASTRKTAVKKSAPGSSPGSKPLISVEQRLHYIEVAAYYIAERRSFADANPNEDWAQAEIEIDRLLGEGKLNP
jgi:hypothetical protein